MSRPIGSRRWREKAVLVRQNPGHRDERGVWVNGEEVRTDVKLVTAPASEAELRVALPDGARLQDARRFWLEGINAEPLRVGDQASDSDVIEYLGTRYRVRHVQDWQPRGFIELLAVRVEGQG